MLAFSALLLLAAIPAYSQSLPAFRWGLEVDGSASDLFAGIGTDAQGNIYLAGTTTSSAFQVQSAIQPILRGYSNAFVSKLDASGNIIYSTYFGGSGTDNATAMTVDPAGNVYVTGTTSSADFPTTKGVYAASLPPAFQGVTVNVPRTNSAFLFRLNPDGSLAYSTYFAAAQLPNAIAIDSSGSVYLSGATFGGLPTTPGAYSTSWCCDPIPPGEIPILYIPNADTFLTKFDPTASTLIFSTYLGVGANDEAGGRGALAVGTDGSAYIGSPSGIYHLDPTASTMLASLPSLMSVQAIAFAPDGSLYVAGSPFTGFQATAGVFQPAPPAVPNLYYQINSYPAAIARLDAQLQGVIVATYFYGRVGNSIASLAIDAAGNVYVGGSTGLGLPTRTPFFTGFGGGYVSELSGDLSTLLFSSYFGDDAGFTIQGVAIGSNGSVILAGIDGQSNFGSPPGNLWVNSLSLAPPPALRIDSIQNAASMRDGPISSGETILVDGAGFGPDSQLLINGSPVPAILTTASTITAVVPANLQTAATFAVESASAETNEVLIPVSTTSPGVFSATGIGYGQGYILNQNGSVNSPSNPAYPGDRITIFATGVGPVSFTDGYAVAQFLPAVFIDTFYCDGVAAYMGPLTGFPGDVYQLTVYVPNPAALEASYPNLGNFAFPSQSSLILEMNGVESQTGLAISIGN
jgi:uncharacterized protein (TIGR03437 family)